MSVIYEFTVCGKGIQHHLGQRSIDMHLTILSKFFRIGFVVGFEQALLDRNFSVEVSHGALIESPILQVRKKKFLE